MANPTVEDADDPGGRSSAEQLLPLLRGLRLFAGLPDDELAAVARSTRRQRATKGAVIVSQGETGAIAFVIVAGTVDVLLESAEGQQIVVARLGPGDHFGELALLDAGPRSATVVAAANTDLLCLQQNELLRHPGVIGRILAALATRLRHTDSQVASLAFQETSARLARFLTAHARPGPHGLAVEVTQDELAAQVGTTRQTVARIFGTWRQRRYIATIRGRTIILDAAALATASKV